MRAAPLARRGPAGEARAGNGRCASPAARDAGNRRCRPWKSAGPRSSAELRGEHLRPDRGGRALPGVSAVVRQRGDPRAGRHLVAARLTVNYRGPALRPHDPEPERSARTGWRSISTEGPFRRFEGEWRLAELAADACKIEFMLRYEFDSALVGRLAGGVFDGIANTLVDAFARRAEQAPAGRSRPARGQADPTPGKSS